jgi:hypothetical protein
VAQSGGIEASSHPEDALFYYSPSAPVKRGDSMPNIFREAKLLLAAKKESEMTEDERTTVNAALIPFNIKGFPLSDEITIDEGLEIMAKILEGEHETAG